MNRLELTQKLNLNKVDPYSYCLDGGLPSEQYCLDFDGVKWNVYYSERGVKSHLKEFMTEVEACNYFYEYITGDDTVFISS